MDSGVRFGRNIKINFNGNNNKLYLDNNCKLISGSITLSGSSNSVYLGSQFSIKGAVIDVQGSSNLINFGDDCILNANTDVTFNGDDNTLNAISSIEFMPGSRIGFRKNNNYAFFGHETKIMPASKINFSGNNALLYVCGKCRLNLPAGLITNVIFFYGFGSSIGSNLSFQIREAKNIIIGSDCMFSLHIHLRNAAGHGIYDGATGKRIAKGQSLIIGDHVWLGWGVMVVKGLKIGCGSMIGGGSIVSRDIPEKCLAAGNPAKVIRENILWVRQEPYDSNGVMREEFDTYTEPTNKPTSIGWERLLEIDTIPSSTLAKEKAEIIHKILDD